MRVLVTGGAGFIGSHIVEHFQADADVIVLDDLRTGRRRNIDGFNVRFHEGSVLDRNLLRTLMQGVDYVFHLAAMVSVPESMGKPTDCELINTAGTLTVLEEAARAGVRKLCLSSTSAVYGDNPVNPKAENMLPEPKSPYAVSKLSAEHYCRMFAAGGRLKTVALRYFNVFGPRQDPGSQYAAAVPIFVSKAVKGEPLTIFDDGEQTRDFVYVKDIVAANVFFAQSDEAFGVYNIANGNRITINGLASMICQLTGSSSAIQHLPPRPGDVKHSQAAVEKASLAGFRPTHAFEDGLARTIDFFR